MFNLKFLKTYESNRGENTSMYLEYICDKWRSTSCLRTPDFISKSNANKVRVSSCSFLHKPDCCPRKIAGKSCQYDSNSSLSYNVNVRSTKLLKKLWHAALTQQLANYCYSANGVSVLEPTAVHQNLNKTQSLVSWSTIQLVRLSLDARLVATLRTLASASLASVLASNEMEDSNVS